jgi:hypothetical protein
MDCIEGSFSVNGEMVSRIERYDLSRENYWDFLTTDDGKPIGSVKAIVNAMGVPYFTVEFEPLEFIDIDDEEKALGLLTKLYETTLEYLNGTEG